MAAPVFGRVGATVHILGTDLTGATSVAFDVVVHGGFGHADHGHGSHGGDYR